MNKKLKKKIYYLINCGSSSQKNYVGQVTYNEQGEVIKVDNLLSISAERLNTLGSIVKAKDGNGDIISEVTKDNMNHEEAAELGIKAIMQIMPLHQVELIINRAVNVGKFMRVCYLNEETEAAMELNADRAPEHNPPALVSIRLLKAMMPEATQILVPDSNAHVTIPEVAYTYAIVKEWTEEFGIRKMGFHGSVVCNAIRELSAQVEQTQCIIAHLGNGCSVTAVKEDKVLDTSMGLTPLTGTVMGTRSGDIDPSMIPILADKLQVSAEEVIKLLNKKCGLLGVSGIGSDFRDLLDAYNEGHEGAKKAVELFIYRACLEIAKYQLPIGGMRQLVFSGGIGENSAYVRERICSNFEYLGVKLDKAKNECRYSSIAKISAEDSAIDVYIIPADELKEMVRQAVTLIAKE